MSREVDERVVKMGFDNAQFESGVRTTLNSLDRLKESLSFDNINGRGLSALGDNVAIISERFTTMGIIATTALQRIADKAVDTGEKVVKALTIKGAQDGWKEYELKIDSVKTILSSAKDVNGLPVTLDMVNEKLDELNHYADKTIYSFSDMTSNIGKFTNAGVDLDKSVAAIQGVSNLAALSGANAQDASHAMYNIAQALGSGSLKLIDWKSIQVAHMDTVDFKNELIKTGVELGTLVKQGDKYVSTTTDMHDKISEAFNATEMWNESLSHQWITTDVLTTTLAKYSDESTELGRKAMQAATEVNTATKMFDALGEAIGSGWAASWEIIIGDFDESKALWTAVNDELSSIINKQANYRNELLQGWKDLGGRQAVLGAFTNVWKGLKEVVEPVRDAMQTVFPPVTAERLVNISERIKEITERFHLSDDANKNLKKTFQGLFSAVDLGRQTFSALYQIVRPYLGVLPKIGGTILDLTGKFGGWVSSLRDSVLENDTLYQTLSGIVTQFQNGLNAVKPFADVIVSHLPKFQSFSDVLAKVREEVDDYRTIFHNAAGFVSDFFGSFLKGDESTRVLDGFSRVIDKIADGLGKVGTFLSTVKEFVMSFQLSDETVANLHSTFSGLFAVVDLVQQAFDGLFRAFRPMLGTFDEFQGGVFTAAGFLGELLKQFFGVTGSIGDFVTGLAESARESDFFYETFKKVADVFGMGLGAIGYVLDLIQSHLPSMEEFAELLRKVKEYVSPMGDLFSKAADAVGGFFGAFRQNEAAVGVFETFAKIFGTVWTVLYKIGTFIKSTFSKGFQNLTDTLVNLDTQKLEDILTSGALFSMFGGAAGLIQNLKNTVAGVGDILGGFKDVLDGITGTLEAMQMKVKAGVIATIAGSVLALAAAVVIMSGVDSDKLHTALGAIGGLLIEVGVTFAALGKLFAGKNLRGFQQAIGAMKNIAVAVAILAVSMVLLKDLSLADIGKGLLAIGGLMAGLTIVAVVLSKQKGKIVKGATGLILFAAAIAILTKSLASVKELQWPELIKGLVAVGALIAGLSAAINFTNFAGFGLSQGLGIVAFAKALEMLTGVVQQFGSMNLSALVQGLLALGAVLAGITIAVNFMPKNLPALGLGLMLFSTALLLVKTAIGSMGNMSWEQIGKGFLVLGGALLGLTIALNAMKGALPGAAAMIVAAGAIMILTPALMALSLLSWEGIAKALVTLAGTFVIFGVAGALLGPVLPVILGLSGALALAGLAALALGAGLTMLSIALGAIGVGATVAAGSLGAALTIIITDLIGLIPAVIVAIGKGIIQLLYLLGDGAEAIGYLVINAGLAILDAIGTLVPKIVEVALKLIVAFLEGIARGIPAIVQAAFELVMAFINAVAEALRANDEGLIAAVQNLISAIIELLLTTLQAIVSTIPGFGKGMAEALERAKGRVREVLAPKDFKMMGENAEKALGGSFSKSGTFVKAVETETGEGLSVLSGFGGVFSRSGKTFAEELGEGFSSYDFSDFDLGDSLDLSPTITPVLDLSELTGGIGDFDNPQITPTIEMGDYSDLLSGISLDMEGFRTDNQNLAASMDTLQTTSEEQNGKLDSMNDYLNEYLPYFKKIDGLKVVMDTGELVGTLEGPLDEALAARQMSSVRSGRF